MYIHQLVRTMKSRSKPPRTTDPCAAYRADDGVPSIELAKRERYRKRPNQAREQQLCHQAWHALDAAIACDCDAPELRDAEVIDVAPGRGIHMLVARIAIRDTSPEALDATHRALNEHLGTLRAAIAAAIHRKRVPTLRFIVVTSQ